MATLDEVKKAYEDLSDEDKKSFEQSIADRVHESIAAQEKAKGETDSQSAEAREHEALGAEHADDKGDVKKLGENDDDKEEMAEDAREKAQEAKADSNEERISGIESRLERIEKMLSESARKPREADEATADKLSELAKKFD